MKNGLKLSRLVGDYFIYSNSVLHFHEVCENERATCETNLIDILLQVVAIFQQPRFSLTRSIDRCTAYSFLSSFIACIIIICVHNMPQEGGHKNPIVYLRRSIYASAIQRGSGNQTDKDGQRFFSFLCRSFVT